jgi:hypothetical protein
MLSYHRCLESQKNARVRTLLCREISRTSENLGAGMKKTEPHVKRNTTQTICISILEFFASSMNQYQRRNIQHLAIDVQEQICDFVPPASVNFPKAVAYFSGLKNLILVLGIEQRRSLNFGNQVFVHLRHSVRGLRRR